MTENQSSLTDSQSVMTDRVGSVCPDRVVCNNVDKQTGCLILYGGGVCESRTPGKEKKIVKQRSYLRIFLRTSFESKT